MKRQYKLSRNTKRNLMYAILVIILILIFSTLLFAISVIDVQGKKVTSVDESINSTNIEQSDNIEDENTDSIEIESRIIGDTRNYFTILQDDLDSIKNQNIEIIEKYFGTSDVFTPETVADRVSLSTVTLINEEVTSSNEEELIIHICTVDYVKMNSDYTKYTKKYKKEGLDKNDAKYQAKKDVTKKMLKNKYKVCYNIPIKVSDGSIVVSEAFKQAITGGWYAGVGTKLTDVDCINK